ncbi:MAG TPA: LytTR family DNA-binding domain-containing protein [Azospirillaceae bacterium]|nr:LytTR family DNA-binding domain-containing protein [Azospirillaceae bacterium]
MFVLLIALRTLACLPAFGGSAPGHTSAEPTLVKEITAARARLVPLSGFLFSSAELDLTVTVLTRLEELAPRLDTLAGQLRETRHLATSSMARSGEYQAALARSLDPLRTRWRTALDRARSILADEALDPAQRAVQTRVVMEAIAMLEPLDRLDREIGIAAAIVEKLPGQMEPHRIDVLRMRADLSFKAMRESLERTDLRLRTMIGSTMSDWADLMVGSNGLIEARLRQLHMEAEQSSLRDQSRVLMDELDRTLNDLGPLANLVSWFPGLAIVGLATVMAASSLAWFVQRRHRDKSFIPAEPKAPSTPQASGDPSTLLDLLPYDLGREVIALAMEDHYVRVHTLNGNCRIHMRFREALEGVANLDGRQVHRSYWVATAAVQRIERQGTGRFVIELRNNLRIPISRSQLRALRETGWFERWIVNADDAGPDFASGATPG